MGRAAWPPSSIGSTGAPGSRIPVRSLCRTEAILTGTAGQGGWYTSTVAFSVHASDPGSGIANVNCRVDGGIWTGLCAWVVLGEGVHTLEFYAANGAGLLASTQSIAIWIDL